jgi:hypothetical protein
MNVLLTVGPMSSYGHCICEKVLCDVCNGETSDTRLKIGK